MKKFFAPAPIAVYGCSLSPGNFGGEGLRLSDEMLALAYEEGKKINKPVAIFMVTDPGSIYDFREILTSQSMTVLRMLLNLSGRT